MKIIFILLGFFVFYSIQAKAWDGYDWKNNRYIEIEKDTLVREGETIDFYDYGDGYHTLNIDSIERYGNSVEIEGTDITTGENRTFEMD